MHRLAPTEAASQFGVFTAQQAYRAGWSTSALNGAVVTGRLICLRRATFVMAGDESGSAAEHHHGAARTRLGQLGVAAALRIPRATISHSSAAALHGLALLRTPSRPCITLPPVIRTRPAELHVHRARLSASDVVEHSSVTVTSTPRTCIDVTREFGLTAGVVTTDDALRRGLTTMDALREVYSTLRGRAGLSSGRELLMTAEWVQRIAAGVN